ncbi:MAG TPA: choice-of-anchor J domain-containing protein [Tepidisphaeraceae bacterium]|nr:choice-of-anchor J domain-containing protein [Tepidisphaeraceae bacterium]
MNRMNRSWMAAALTLSLMVCAAPTLAADLFYESFNGATFPPAGWTISNLAGTAITWKTTTTIADDNLTGGTGAAAMIYSSGNPRTIYNAALVSPAISIPGTSGNYQLRFCHLLETWSGDETADVDITTNSGTTWTNLWQRKNVDRELATPSIPLGNYLGKTVQLRFRYYNTTTNAWDLYWQVDDVRVSSILTGDINADNHVNVGDLQRLIAAWGSNNSGTWGNWNPNADLNQDGAINVSDLLVLVANWGI